MRGGIERASGCIGLRGAGKSGLEAGFDYVNVYNQRINRENTHAEGSGGRGA